jgi:hypothetical protein
LSRLTVSDGRGARVSEAGAGVEVEVEADVAGAGYAGAETEGGVEVVGGGVVFV